VPVQGKNPQKVFSSSSATYSRKKREPQPFFAGATPKEWVTMGENRTALPSHSSIGSNYNPTGFWSVKTAQLEKVEV
jgi:hypothetical protein